MLRTFLGLQRGERLLLARAALALSVARLGLSTRPFLWVVERLQGGPGDSPPPAPAGAVSPDRVVWAVEAVSRRLPGEATCLVRALAAHALLWRGGHASRIHIGVAREAAGCLDGHAWLECGGRILMGRPDIPHTTVFSH